VAFAARRRPFAFPLAVGIAGVFAGLAIATLQTARIAHPILQIPVASAMLSGFVEVREERERSDRIVVRVERFDAPGGSFGNLSACASRCAKAAPRPSAALLSLRRTCRRPCRRSGPVGYDFARDMYFQKIGASGYALGAIRIKPAPAAAGFWLRYATIVDGIARRSTIASVRCCPEIKGRSLRR
jgi:competence protein ComEC